MAKLTGDEAADLVAEHLRPLLDVPVFRFKVGRLNPEQVAAMTRSVNRTAEQISALFRVQI